MQPYFRRAYYRPTPGPMAHLPLGARSVGHYRLPPRHAEKAFVKHFLQIFWGMAGMGHMEIGGRDHLLHPRQIAVYLPGMRHVVRSGATDWEYCWWTMDGPLAADTAAAFGLTAGVYDAGEAPLTLLKGLERAIRNPSPASERRAGSQAYHLLALAAGGRRYPADAGAMNQAVRMIHEEWNHPGLCVKQMAGRLRLHRSSFSRRFEAALGIPPAAYLIRLRVRNALAMLRQPDKSIAEISRLCGYADPNYFARLIRRQTGMAPTTFRRRHSSRIGVSP